SGGLDRRRTRGPCRARRLHRRHRPLEHACGQWRDLPAPLRRANDFEPISLVAANAQLAVVRKSFPANNLKELIDWLKANPDKASQGTAGAGSASHVSGVYL